MAGNSSRAEPINIEDLCDLWEANLELDGSEGGPILIIASLPEKTWICSDLRARSKAVQPSVVRHRPFTPYSEPSWMRANSSAAVPHSMIQSPTCSKRSGSATPASAAANRSPAAASNFRAA